MDSHKMQGRGSLNGGGGVVAAGNHLSETKVVASKPKKHVSMRIWNTLSRKTSKTQQEIYNNKARNTTMVVPQAEEKDKEMIEPPPRKSVSQVEVIEPRKSVSQMEMIEPRKSVSQMEMIEPRKSVSHMEMIEPRKSVSHVEMIKPRKSVSHVEMIKPRNSVSHVEMIKPRKSVSRIEMIEPARKSVSHVEMIDSRKSVSHVEMNAKSVAAFLNVKVIAVDMPGFIQVHAFRCARRTYDGLDKLSYKHMAYNMKKEFDRVYGPAWHCIVGSSFGSFVTHSTGFFLYFSIEKTFVLIFKTKVQRALD